MCTYTVGSNSKKTAWIRWLLLRLSNPPLSQTWSALPLSPLYSILLPPCPTSTILPALAGGWRSSITQDPPSHWHFSRMHIHVALEHFFHCHKTVTTTKTCILLAAGPQTIVPLVRQVSRYHYILNSVSKIWGLIWISHRMFVLYFI